MGIRTFQQWSDCLLREMRYLEENSKVLRKDYFVVLERLSWLFVDLTGEVVVVAAVVGNFVLEEHLELSKLQFAEIEINAEKNFVLSNFVDFEQCPHVEEEP